MSLCDSCKYQYNVEQLKPCIIYRDDCEFYEPDDFHKEPKTGHCKWRKDSDEVFRRGVSMESLCASCYVRNKG